jgi:uncharacterized protein YgbK (DUF1537 family)
VKARIASLDDARQALREGRHLVLQVQRGADDSELREFFFGLADPGIAAMLMTGGDTGATICRILGINAVSLEGEIVVGLPWGIARGGPMEGLRVATKSGGFGAPDALVRTAEFFSGRVA